MRTQFCYSQCGSTVIFLFFILITLPYSFSGEPLFDQNPSFVIVSSGNFFGLATADIYREDYNRLVVGTKHGFYLISLSPNTKKFSIDSALIKFKEDKRPYSFTFGDVDGDGFPELFVYDAGDTNVYGYKNSKGIFNPNHFWIDADFEKFFLADITLGGRKAGEFFPRLAVVGSAKARIYENAAGSIEKIASWITNKVEGGLAVSRWCDLDLDGFPELIIVPRTHGRIGIFKNERGAIAKNPSWTSARFMWLSDLTFSDINGDKYPDMLVSAGLSEREPATIVGKIYLNNRLGNFEPAPYWQEEKAHTGARGVGIFDLNKDGYPDIVIGGYTTTRVYLNHNGVFQKTPEWNVKHKVGTGRWVQVVDLERDGKEELVLADGATLQIYRSCTTD